MQAERTTIADLRALGRKFLGEFGKQLVEEYGPMSDSPEDHADRLINEAEDIIREFRQYVQSKRTA